ncbi:hypothetical protein EG328_008609 [Venturia inaequalis]|uniref:Uncharacterized protein n=1 Tax=Venturia inaequalis TaxID=5025 RepID=A0A8H3Z543_VENIN|nr:hypothetical protein EG328_008609 [Venturia inaequalis]KAE9980066.1 hypothetical protein EG327_006696 [Venturia inaequalis]RDI77044.1 hypothetical protein Vi05172_g12981 [Venturia inaequalis]
MIIKAMLHEEWDHQDKWWSRAQACGENRCEHIDMTLEGSAWEEYNVAKQDCKFRTAVWAELRPLFDLLESTLMSKFGLKLDIAKQCSPWSDRLPYNTTGLKWIRQAYLILPSATFSPSICARESDRVDNVYYNTHTLRLGSFINPSLLQLTEEQRRRFQWAMKKLDLKPSLASRAIKWPDGELVARGGHAAWSEEKIRAAMEAHLEGEEKGPWPRLLNTVERSCAIVNS